MPVKARSRAGNVALTFHEEALVRTSRVATKRTGPPPREIGYP